MTITIKEIYPVGGVVWHRPLGALFPWAAVVKANPAPPEGDAVECTLHGEQMILWTPAVKPRCGLSALRYRGDKPPPLAVGDVIEEANVSPIQPTHLGTPEAPISLETPYPRALPCPAPCPRCAELEAELARLRPPRWALLAEIVVPVATVSEANTRSHPQVRATRARRQRETVTAHLACRYPIRRPPRVHRVRLVRLGERALDTDNLAGALKAVRDAVAAWLGVDDGLRGGIVWEVDQEPHKRHRNQPAVRIELYRKETP